MLTSMTGFGQGEVSNRKSSVAVEIRTVNHRYLDLSIKMPRLLGSREYDIKELLKEKINRGRVVVTISMDTDQPDYDVKINVPLMEQYIEKLGRFAKRKGVGGALDINTMATLPEVFHLKENDFNADHVWPLVERGLKQALSSCVKMRRDEGRVLETDLRARLAAITKVVSAVEKRAPKVIAAHRAALHKRLDKGLEGAKLDNNRWMTEVAIMSEKLDFAEEVTRLKSHLVQIKACFDRGGAVAKKLTYLLQEVHREATTIASKASDASVAEFTVSLREETERLREQVQNIE